MHASTVFVAAFAALAAAAPSPKKSHKTDTRPYENIDIADFFVRKSQALGSEKKTIDAVSFKLSGDDAHDLLCSASNPGFPSEVITCGDSKYRFVLEPGSDKEYEFGLTIYHETGPAAGLFGTGNVPTYCHAGGDGPDDFVCNQVNPTTIGITNSL